MLTAVLAHVGRPPAPHDVWTAWNADPLLVAGLGLAVWLYHRGRIRGRRSDPWRAWCFAGALLALAVALLSPLDAASTALASAHMVQHLLLVLVAAPLLALSAPTSTLLRGSPLAVRRASVRLRRRLRLRALARSAVTHPVAVWLLHVTTLWFWHAAGPYDAALRNELFHVSEHASFLVTGVVFWHVVVGARSRVPQGLGVLLLFAAALQSAFLSVLLTFSPTIWYDAYATTTQAWALTPLADQQLAGVIMWVPGGILYLAVALRLLAGWLHEAAREDRFASGVPPSAGPTCGGQGDPYRSVDPR